MKLITCEFNMDSGCVELRFDDGTELDINYTVVESKYAHTVRQKTELDWLVYNAPFYRTMVDALDAQMNSSIDSAFQREGAMDAYICEALLYCIEQGDYVDLDDVRSHISNERAVSAVLARLDSLDVK